ncbi:unnamed protein product [Toxocara canis]|uniref:Uncharacterized protein n=1 Tax=Toxocara canis TaxID=6265 RepID=A0A183VDB5_TOXCA|nr:unnamed protein product [Toxocara canis]
MLQEAFLNPEETNETQSICLYGIIPIRLVNTWPRAPRWGRLGTENIASHSSTEPFVGPCLGSVLRAVIADVILLRPSRFQSGCLVHPFSLSQRCRMSPRTDARSVLCIAMLAVARLSRMSEERTADEVDNPLNGSAQTPVETPSKESEVDERTVSKLFDGATFGCE